MTPRLLFPLLAGISLAAVPVAARAMEVPDPPSPSPVASQTCSLKDIVCRVEQMEALPPLPEVVIPCPA